MLEQHGDVVREVQTSTIAHRHDTAKSVLARTGAAAILFLSLWLRMTGAPLWSILALLGAVAALLLSRRWSIERRHPKPRTQADRRAYVWLRGGELVLLLALLGGFSWVNRRDDPEVLWLLAAILLAFGVAHALVIEPAYRRLFARIAEAETA